MDEIRQLGFFLVRCANYVWYTLNQYWFFSALFGIFFISISIDLLLSFLSHVNIIRIPYKPFISRFKKFRLRRFRKIKYVSFSQIRLHSFAQPKLLYKLNFKVGFIDRFLARKNLREENEYKISQKRKQIAVEKEKIENWKSDIAYLKVQIAHLKKKGGTSNFHLSEKLQFRIDHLNTLIKNSGIRINQLIHDIHKLSHHSIFNRFSKFFKKHKLKKQFLKNNSSSDDNDN